MRYLPLSQPSPAYAAAISGHLYALSRPPEVRDPADVSRYWCGWIVHPTLGDVALAMPEEDVPVHPDADPVALVATIEHALLPGEADTLRSVIEANRDQRAEPLQFIPASLVGKLLTHEQAEALGWFADPLPGGLL